jgi:hypothetical protein
MTFNDVELIVKKIIVGILLVVIPAVLLWYGLQLTISLLSPKTTLPASVVTNHQ